MQARFRKIGPDGREVDVGDVTALADAVRTGSITPSTLLYDAVTERWSPAGDHDVVRAAMAVASNMGRFSLPEPAFAPPPAPASPAYMAAEVAEPPAAPTAAQREKEEMRRLAAFVGENWGHYEEPFRRMLKKDEAGVDIGGGWNWAAFFLSPWWFMYRRLYVPFFAFGIGLWLARSLHHAVNDGQTRMLALAFIPLGIIIAQGWAADRLLFKRARQVLRENPDAELVRLAELGAPNNWAWLCGIGLIVLAVLAAILSSS
jgi:hypothetical protein